MSSEKEAKLKALQLTLDKLDKAYGKGTVMKMGDKAVEEVEVIPSGSLGLDLALGVNGYPKGRIIEIYGPESSGKTTLTIDIMQKSLVLISKILSFLNPIMENKRWKLRKILYALALLILWLLTRLLH